MTFPPDVPPFAQFAATADRVVRDRPGVDADMIREIFRDAATMLHNGLALDGLDVRDTDTVVAALCIDLVAPDPGAALRARARAARDDPGDLHDPDAAYAAYLDTVRILQL